MVVETGSLLRKSTFQQGSKPERYGEDVTMALVPGRLSSLYEYTCSAHDLLNANLGGEGLPVSFRLASLICYF